MRHWKLSGQDLEDARDKWRAALHQLKSDRQINPRSLGDLLKDMILESGYDFPECRQWMGDMLRELRVNPDVMRKVYVKEVRDVKAAI